MKSNRKLVVGLPARKVTRLRSPCCFTCVNYNNAFCMLNCPCVNGYGIQPCSTQQDIDQADCFGTLTNYLIFLDFNSACLNYMNFHNLFSNKRMFFPNPGSTNIFPSSQAVLPRSTTFLTLPFTFQPSKGVQPQRVNISAARISCSASSSTSIHVSGCSGRLKILRGLVYIFSIIWLIVNTLRALCRPSLTAVRSKGRMVSRPGKPGGGFSESFSSRVWGAWSVAKQS